MASEALSLARARTAGKAAGEREEEKRRRRKEDSDKTIDEIIDLDDWLVANGQGSWLTGRVYEAWAHRTETAPEQALELLSRLCRHELPESPARPESNSGPTCSSAPRHRSASPSPTMDKCHDFSVA